MQNQPSGTVWPSLFWKKNLVFEWVNFQNSPKFEIKRKFEEKKSGNFGQNLAQNQADCIMNGLLFLQKLVYLYGSTFKFQVAHTYQNHRPPSPPPPLQWWQQWDTTWYLHCTATVAFHYFCRNNMGVYNKFVYNYAYFKKDHLFWSSSHGWTWRNQRHGPYVWSSAGLRRMDFVTVVFILSTQFVYKRGHNLTVQ